MSYIPLTEYKHPRILMLDFSPQDVSKVQQAGFEALRGATGLYDHNNPKEFCLPFAIQDVEILFAQVQTSSFTGEDRIASTDSIEESLFLRDLMREIWRKPGWSVLFISQNKTLDELVTIGLERLGIIANGRHHLPESIREPLQKALNQDSMYNHAKSPELPPAQIPRFFGQAVHMADDEPETKILKRYIKSAEMSVLTCLEYPHQFLNQFLAPSQTGNHPHVLIFGEVESITWLIRDDSVDGNVTALKLNKSVYAGRNDDGPIYDKGQILLLPDFKSNNINVALALLQEVITEISPHLFDTPQHPWLKEYQPAPVLDLITKREVLIEETLQKIEQLDSQAETEYKKYTWLSGLLVSLGDQFATDVAQALRFLGFEVEEVDNTLGPNERRREDLWVWDKAVDYFALGEAKTTGKGRGASEDFITKTQTHQTRYARENQQVPPLALLVVNYATDLDPALRTGRFYQTETVGRLEENGITALDSVALFNLCQYVLNDQVSKEQVRRFITGGQAIITSIAPETIEEIKKYSIPS